MYGIGEMCIFYCFEKMLSCISNRKPFDTHMLYQDEIPSFDKRAYTGSLYVGHGDAASILQKLKAALNIFNTLIN